MAARKATADSGPANTDFLRPQGGYKFRWVEWIENMSLSGATVTLNLWHANTAGTPDRTLTTAQAEWNGTNGGLVVANGGNAPNADGTTTRTGNADASVTIIIPPDFATSTEPTAYYHLVIAPSGGIEEPYKSGAIEYYWQVSR